MSQNLTNEQLIKLLKKKSFEEVKAIIADIRFVRNPENNAEYQILVETILQEHGWNSKDYQVEFYQREVIKLEGVLEYLLNKNESLKK